jgi:hypothetical protein
LVDREVGRLVASGENDRRDHITDTRPTTASGISAGLLSGIAGRINPIAARISATPISFIDRLLLSASQPPVTAATRSSSG